MPSLPVLLTTSLPSSERRRPNVHPVITATVGVIVDKVGTVAGSVGLELLRHRQQALAGPVEPEGQQHNREHLLRVPTQASACNTQTAATNSAPKPRLCRKDRTPKRLQGYDIALEVTMPNTAAKRLYDLLDSLVALRLEFATGAEGDEALSPLGRSKVLAVRTVLDTAIQGTKQIIGAIERPKPPPA